MFEVTIAGKDGKVIKRYELSGDRPLRIGRSTECDIQISVPIVSRQHAEIRPVDDDTWVIRDLGSTHGCTVRGQKIRELTVSSGLEVEIGPAVIRFESMNDRIGAELDAMIREDE